MADKSRVKTGTCSSCKAKKVKVVKFKGVQVCIENCLVKTLEQRGAAKKIKLSEVTKYLAETGSEEQQDYLEGLTIPESFEVPAE